MKLNIKSKGKLAVLPVVCAAMHFGLGWTWHLWIYAFLMWIVVIAILGASGHVFRRENFEEKNQLVAAVLKSFDLPWWIVWWNRAAALLGVYTFFAAGFTITAFAALFLFVVMQGYRQYVRLTQAW